VDGQLLIDLDLTRASRRQNLRGFWTLEMPASQETLAYYYILSDTQEQDVTTERRKAGCLF